MSWCWRRNLSVGRLATLWDMVTSSGGVQWYAPSATPVPWAACAPQRPGERRPHARARSEPGGTGSGGAPSGVIATIPGGSDPTPGVTRSMLLDGDGLALVVLDSMHVGRLVHADIASGAVTADDGAIYWTGGDALSDCPADNGTGTVSSIPVAGGGAPSSRRA